MFDIIKDLKENIQKNNMKKLVISAVLGMFCYCTNNAMKTKIDEVLRTMLLQQSIILDSKTKIEDEEGKIYSIIKEDDGTVKKGKVLEFIKKQFTDDEKQEECFDDEIKKIEQYFHLEGKKDDYECTKDNLTEIFWSKEKEVGKKEKLGKKEEEVKNKIRNYFIAIIDAEKNTSEVFKEYYKETKEENKGVQYEDILKKIMNDCCVKETEGEEDIQTKFLKKLTNLCEEKDIENNENKTVATIKRRITLDKDIKEGNFISFLKQKIVEEKKNSTKSGKPAEEEVCSCCDC